MIVQLWNTNTSAFVSCDSDLTENYMYISMKFGTGVHVFCWEVGLFNRSSFQSVSYKANRRQHVFHEDSLIFVPSQDIHKKFKHINKDHAKISIPEHPNICLWPWPLTSKINRVHPVVMVNISAKIDEDAQDGVVCFVCARSVWHMHRETQSLTKPPQRYYIPSATCCAGIVQRIIIPAQRVAEGIL